jgi:hypothetical protein
MSTKELVERLRFEADEAFEAGYQIEDSLREAANAIESLIAERGALQAEVERLRAALESGLTVAG